MLRARVFTAAVGLPLLLFGLYLGGPVYYAVVAAIAGLALLEALRLLGLDRTPDAMVLSFLGAAAWLAGAILRPLELFWLALSGSVGLLLLRLVLRYPAATADETARVWLAATYAGLPFAHFILLRRMPDGLALTLLAFIMTWAFDTAAYFGGVRWGRHRLAPTVSPGKTWEGALVGSLATFAVAAIPGSGWPMSLGARLCAAVLVIIFGQIGDLAESAIKRQAGVKDSGRLLPGHGGILDRFDSLMLTVPAIYYLAQFIPVGMPR